MASMINVATENTIPLLTAHRMVTQINARFLARHLTACLKSIRSWSAEGEDGILGELGKNTDGMVHAVEIIDTTINIHGTLSGVGHSNGINTGASAIPMDSAKIDVTFRYQSIIKTGLLLDNVLATPRCCGANHTEAN